MPTRLFMLLALLPCLLPGVWRSDRSGGCGGAEPCMAIVSTTCCGEVIERMPCGATPADCMCSSQSPERPTPQVPPAGPRIDLSIGSESAFSRWSMQPMPMVRSDAGPDAVIVRTHNEARALLCIWRT